MSDYESHSGKLHLLHRYDAESFEDHCKRLWVSEGKSLDDYREGILFEEFYEEYILANDQIWEIIEHSDLGDEDMFCKLTKNEDGSYSFHSRFYNGGTCLTEMISDELENLDEEE